MLSTCVPSECSEKDAAHRPVAARSHALPCMPRALPKASVVRPPHMRCAVSSRRMRTMPAVNVYRGELYMWAHCTRSTCAMRHASRVLVSVFFATASLWSSQNIPHVSSTRYLLPPLRTPYEQGMYVWTHDSSCCAMQSKKCAVQCTVPSNFSMRSTYLFWCMSRGRRMPTV